MTHIVRPLAQYWAGSKPTSSAAVPPESETRAAVPNLRPAASAAVSLTVALRYVALRRSRETIATALWPALRPL